MTAYNRINTRGLFVVFEGLDKSGKSTQCNLLAKNLKKLNLAVKQQGFPDRTTAIGNVINNYLTQSEDLNDKAIHLLFSANRWEKNDFILNSLQNGEHVICDRYAYSGVSFTHSKDIDLEWCKSPDKAGIHLGLIKPDIVFFLNLDPDLSQGRGDFGKERYEKLDFQKKVKNSFQLMKDDSWVVLDASQEVEILEKEILDRILKEISIAKNAEVLKLWM